MFKPIRDALAGLLLAVVFGASQARDTAMLELPRTQFLATDAKAPVSAEIRTAIAAAGNRRGWVVRGEGADKLTLAFAKGDKHEVVVDVLFDKNSFQIVYVSSRNMNFSMDDGRQQIHPNYNKWVRNLNGDLREELMRLH